MNNKLYYMISLCLLAIVVAIPFALDTSFRNFTKDVGKSISFSTSGTGYQDAITPPQINYISYIFWPINIGIVIYGFFVHGLYGFIIIGIIFLTSAMVGALIVPSLRKIFLKILSYSMINRVANYKRDNDEIRAQAMQEVLDLFSVKYGNEILNDNEK